MRIQAARLQSKNSYTYGFNKRFRVTCAAATVLCKQIHLIFYRGWVFNREGLKRDRTEDNPTETRFITEKFLTLEALRGEWRGGGGGSN